MPNSIGIADNRIRSLIAVVEVQTYFTADPRDPGAIGNYLPPITAMP